MNNLPTINISTTPKGHTLVLSGEWTVLYLAPLEKELRHFVATASSPVIIDAFAVTKIDTTALRLVERFAEALRTRGLKVDIKSSQDITDLLQQKFFRLPSKNEVIPNKANPLLLHLNDTGAAIVEEVRMTRDKVGFAGWVFVLFATAVIKPWKLRFTPLVANMEQVGLRAVPIVSLLTFLIGLVVMYMGAQQLAHFGAQVFSINLLEVATLRELAPMLTAIVVAGRSGSSFTAQIGAMVANEELAAMRVMGLEPMECLVLPRVLALVIMLPILTVLADFAGIMGGAVASFMIMDMSFASFIAHFHEAATLNSFFTGLVKAPFFAITISIIGCFHGHRVTGSASSVGALTTQSVVESIFMVIAIDAAFALIYSAIGV